jgi:hypothetical protein
MAQLLKNNHKCKFCNSNKNNCKCNEKYTVIYKNNDKDKDRDKGK